MNTIVAIYIAAFILAIFNIILLVEVGVRPNIYTVLLFASILVTNFSYVGISVSSTVEEAIVCNIMLYLGTCYLPFFVFCIGADLAKVSIHPVIRLLMVAFSTLVVGLSFTIGRLPVYYKSVGIVDAGGYTVLVKEYGPLHSLYLIILIAYILASACICISAFFRKKDVSYKNTVLFGLFLTVNFAIYIMDRVFKVNFEWNSISYVISELIIILILNRMNMYDMSFNVMRSWEKMEEYAYIVFDKKRNYLGSNDLAKQYFEELKNQNIDCAPSESLGSITALLDGFENILDKDNNGTRSVYKSTLKLSGRVLRSEVKYLRKKRIISIGDNDIIGYLIEFYDITKESDYISSIEEKNERLAIAEKRALDASNAKSSFLSSMSHEIRTPINTILGMNEMISRESHDMVILGYSRDVEKAGRMLLSLVNDVLDFSKIESGNFSFEEKQYSVPELVKVSGDMLEKRAAEKNLRISIDVDPGMPSGLVGDSDKIEQILVNLITNAVKYTNEGYVRISVTGDYIDDYYNLIVSVSDTGIGIKSEDIGHIFDSFSRADIRKNRHIEGTGLGLAITKRLCEGMGGNIRVSSRYGEGSVFTVSIPQKIGDGTLVGAIKPEEKKAHVKKKKYEPSFIAPNAKVLIVDDNEMNLAVFVSLLKGTKVSIDKAMGGNEALELTREKKYDVIYMDHMMPAPDGIETMHMIRSDENNPNKETPQVALTANAVSGSMEMYLSEGFEGYLSKPVDPYELEDSVRKYLSEDMILDTKSDSAVF